MWLPRGIICFATILMLPISNCLPTSGDRDDDAPVAYLAINAQAQTNSQSGRITVRRLEMNWFNHDEANHKIELYASDPDMEPIGPMMSIDTADHPDGFYTTDIQLPQPSSEELGYKRKCVFDYWVRLVDKTTRSPVTKTRCLELQPSWMSDNAEALGSLKFSDLMMVKTHDAAAYKSYGGAGDDNLITLATFAQEENLEQQLQWGSRVLDIRIGYYPTTPETFWLVHGIIKAHPLQVGLDQVKNFLQNSHDIMVFKIGAHEQPWDEQAYEELYTLLRAEFHPWLVTPTSDNLGMTLNELWKQPVPHPEEGRVIVIDDNRNSGENNFLFKDYHGHWCNVNDPMDLKSCLDEYVGNVANHTENPKYKPWGQSCQMTPNSEDIVLGRWFGLRDMADAVNRNVTKWFQTLPDFTSIGSLITGHDFFLSTDMVYVGIQRSLKIAAENAAKTMRQANPVAYLAINAQAKTDSTGMTLRRLEVNWFNTDEFSHKVVLYNTDPEIDASNPLMTIDPVVEFEGFFVTDIMLPQPSSEELGYQPRCVFDYWVRIEEKDTNNPVTGARCLKMQPSWMTDNAEQLGDAKFSDLMMVKTHDSAAYKYYEGAGDDNLITLATFAQEESLEQQLQWGVRVLDIRLGFYPTTPERFWLVHGIIKAHPLQMGLDQVKNFLTNSHDIMIFRIGAHEQVWDGEAFDELYALLSKEFGPWLVKPGPEELRVTLNEIWKLPVSNPDQGRIMITDGGRISGDDNFLFEEFYAHWCNVNDPLDLKSCLDQDMSLVASDHENPKYNPWGPECQMTPEAEDILLGKWFGLRDMADAVNRDVTRWFQTIPEYSTRGSMLTGHDFFLSTDMIHVGIERSLKVASEMRQKRQVKVGAYLSINAWAKTDPDTGEITHRRLEINWFNADESNHQVALYDQDPESGSGLPIMVLYPDSDGFFVTDIMLPQPSSEELGYQAKCVFDYWVRIEDNSNGNPVTKVRCLEMQPSWMTDNADTLGEVNYSDLMLTITHDAAAYKSYEGAGDDNLVTLATFAQEESLEQQLQWGVRALDIRIGYYPTTPEVFWLVHGIIKTHPLQVGLDQVKNFLRNSKDIVLFYIRAHEQEWNDNAYALLEALLQEEFRPWLVSPTKDQLNVKLNDIWYKPELEPEQGRVLMISRVTITEGLFFDTVHDPWCATSDPMGLKSCLDTNVGEAFGDQDNDKYHPWGPQCQMTPNADDIVSGRWFGLRDMADAVNRNVTKWFETIPEYSSISGMITFHDFILSTDMIQVGIERSLQAGSKSRK